MKKVMILSSALLLLLFIGFSSAMTFSKTAINDVIVREFNQPAHFSVSLGGVNAGSYQLYSLADVSLSPKGYFVLGGGTNVIDVYVYPTDQLTEKGYYTFEYALKQYIGDSFPDKMTIRVVNLKDAIEISSDTIAPDTDNITFYVQNDEKSALNNIHAVFNSVFFDNLEETFNLGPLQKVEFSVPISKDKLKTIKAGAYIVNGVFDTDAGKATVSGKIYLGEKKNIRTEEDKSGFFISTDSITKTNTGNVPQDVNIIITKNIITRLFTSFNVEPQIVDRNGLTIAYTWTKALDPAEAFVVKARTNYIFPIVVILLAAFIVFAFKRFMETKVLVRKSVSPIRAKGGEFALRVSVRVKAKRNVENVSLIDRVPALVKIHDSFGVVKPSKIDAANRRIHWDLGSMQAGEERIVSYIVYSKIGVVGKFSLPAALAVFERDAKIHEIESNNVYFLSEQTRRDD
jgi:hypothetical protein